MSKYEIEQTFIDKYNRIYKIIEIITKKDENGNTYNLFNLYPPTVKPIKAFNSIGFEYEPYLYMTEKTLNEIFIRNIEKEISPVLSAYRGDL
jgi:hypothetical protein